MAREGEAKRFVKVNSEYVPTHFFQQDRDQAAWFFYALRKQLVFQVLIFAYEEEVMGILWQIQEVQQIQSFN